MTRPPVPEGWEFRLSHDRRHFAFYDPGNGPWFVPEPNMRGRFVDSAEMNSLDWYRYTPQPEPAATDRAALRDRIAEALLTTRRTDYEGAVTHRQHRYDARCALCAADVDALTEAVLAVLPPTGRAATLRELEQRQRPNTPPSRPEPRADAITHGVPRVARPLDIEHDELMARAAAEHQARTAAEEARKAADRAAVLREAAEAVARYTGNDLDANAQMLRRLAAETQQTQTEMRLPPTDRAAELKRRSEVAQSFHNLAAQAREDGDYEGEASILGRLEDRQQQWARIDAAEQPHTKLPFIHIDDDGDQLDIGAVMASTYDGEAPVVYVAADQHQGDQVATVYVRPERVDAVIAALHSARQAAVNLAAAPAVPVEAAADDEEKGAEQ